MKVLLLLFSIYLLALGCLPCADSDCAEQTTTVAAQPTHHGDCHSEESCPPFCVCSCCSIQLASASTTLVAVQPLQLVFQRDMLGRLHQPLLSRASNSIWQPPRLG